MPNHTANTLSIHGPARTVRAVSKLLHSKDSLFDFERIIPRPAELSGNEWQHDKAVAAANLAKYGAEGWYDWNIGHWGTKWNAYEVQRHERKNADKSLLIEYTFCTAWSPPEPVIVALSEKYPTLKFTLEAHEEGHCWPSFIGVWQEGEQTSYEEIPHRDEEENEVEEDA